MACERLILPLSIALVLLSLPLYGQINMPCTTSMLTSFTPCMNFITNSSADGTSPTSDCCSLLKSFMINGTDCLCQIATGGVPFNIPISRSLALSLPRACNMPGVPLQCKASAAPIPAPGPPANGPGVSPADTLSPEASNVPVAGSPTLAPEADTTPALTPPSSTTNSGFPNGNSGNRQSVTPSAASAQSFSPLLLLAVFGAIALKNY
ncbi:hypothetical protein ACH5RR_031329 [Cinchona calisaya]|uniref:Bifunctional inhibitor/plant lipid transfer protein/seed storage helical domain-containing protein n=1 Tax=Cinchona calisaya TaxID=153742 RepID=A0ABD2YEX7_9GENT